MKELILKIVVAFLVVIALGTPVLFYMSEWYVLKECLEQGHYYNRFTGHVLCHRY